MKFKRLAAILISMIMTVEAVPSFVFAMETGLQSEETIAAMETESGEEEKPEAEETKPSTPSVKETQVAKETTETKPEETETSEADNKDESNPEEKEPAASETERTEETEPSGAEPAGTEPEGSVPEDNDDADQDSKTPANGVESEPSESTTSTEEPKLKDGEVIVEQDRPVETHIISTTADNDKQLEAYFKKQAESQVAKPQKRLLKSAAAGTRLDKTTSIAYSYVKTRIAEIAAGSITSTKISIPVSLFDSSLTTQTWSAEDLGVGKVLTDDGKHITNEASEALRNMINISINLSALDNALLSDCPYELYWFDKTIGVRLFSYAIGAKKVGKEYVLYVHSGPELWFSVSADYADANCYEIDPSDGIKRFYKTASAKISRVNTAIKNAASYVNAAKDKTDYQKLNFYCDKICALVKYDEAAVSGSKPRSYGDPWQMISVFDGDTNTNVVCEGYAKAFMYLCEMSTFEGDISCITATGYISNGGHMWNIVNMDDGKNYIVDVTNVDGHNSDFRKALFLNGGKTPIKNGYSFTIGSMSEPFTYDEDCLKTYSEEQLKLSDDKYYIARPVNLVDPVNGTVTLSKESALPDEVVKITPIPADGYMVDYIMVNDECIAGETFLMTGVEAKVEVIFKLAPYDITLKHNTGGTITADKNTAYFSEKVNITVTPDQGYKVCYVNLNGKNLSDTSFTMPDEDVTIEVVFMKVMYPVTIDSTIHGTVVADYDNAGYGDTVTLDLKPDEGYYVDSVLVNGTPVSGISFTMPAEIVHVEVTFKEITQQTVGDVITDRNSLYKYKVTNNAMNGSGTVSYVGSESTSAGISIPPTVILNGISYKITRIAPYAFYYNSTVTSVYVGANVLIIDSRAFVACPKLVKINGGLRLKTICNRAVVNCPRLSTFVITSTVLKTIGAYSFYGDKSLKTIYINKTTKLTKKSVKKSLKGSKVKTVKVKKSKVSKYKRYFTKRNSGRKVTVKK